jgi:hypothetical protein
VDKAVVWRTWGWMTVEVQTDRQKTLGRIAVELLRAGEAF